MGNAEDLRYRFARKRSAPAWGCGGVVVAKKKSPGSNLMRVSNPYRGAESLHQALWNGLYRLVSNPRRGTERIYPQGSPDLIIPRD